MFGKISTSIIVCGFLSAIAAADVVQEWSDHTLDAIRADRTNPPKAARALAMAHIAMFDAINAIDKTHEPFLTNDFNAPATASREAAAATAAWVVLRSLYPNQATNFDNFIDATLAAIADSNSEFQGIALGEAVGYAMIAARANDRFDATVMYTPGTQPGDWQPTPPAQAPALLPGWGEVLPFCLEDVATLRRPGPPPLTSAEFTTTFNETKSLGSKTSATRTADQTQIAQFWVDGPGTATPPGHWFQIARDVANQRGNTPAERVRLFALIGMAVCDAGICAWDNKYTYEDWRPITAIRNADNDGNPDTIADPAWEPLIPTPPFPAYVSGHSTFSGAAAKVLAMFYGTDEIAFTTTSEDVPGVSRSYTRFSLAANEAGRSRIYGGIHWEYDNQDGLALGREIAADVVSNFLVPKEAGLLQIRASEIVDCGPFGLIPLALTLVSLAGMRGAPRRRR